MSGKPIGFESSWKKAEERDRIRGARDRVLQDAEVKAIRKAERREKEESWMLPDLENEFDSKKSKKSKKEKKKKHKSRKKKSKKHRRKSRSSGSESSESEDEWVEKRSEKPDESFKALDETPASRDDWMQMEDLISGSNITRDRRGDRLEMKRQERQKQEESDAVEQNKRELNSAITHKAGGITSCRESSETSPKSNISDGGAAWLKRAYKRAQEQAEREGKSIEEVAAQRWGSLEKFQAMLAKAEGRQRSPEDRRGRRFHQRERSRSPGKSRSKEGFYRPSEGYGDGRYSSRNDDRSRGKSGWKRAHKPSSPDETKRRRRSSSSSSSSERSKSPEPVKEVQKPEQEIIVLSDKEMNALGAKLVKAEMLGNAELAQKLRAKLEAAREAKVQMKESGAESVKEEVVVLTRTDAKGMTRPVDAASEEDRVRGRRKKEKVQTHSKGERQRYFADDDRYDLKQMYEREKLSTAEDQNMMLSRLAGRSVDKTNEDYDLDDVFTDRAATKRSEEADKIRDRDKAIAEHRLMQRTLDDCKFCFGTKNLQKHLLVAVGKNCYLALPHHTPLSEGHCFIVPMSHVSCATQLDEDVYAEMQQFRKALTKMFEDDDDQDCVYFETALRLKRHPHMIMECVPLPREIGNEAPMYFQKAIQECEEEWSHNQKLIKLTNEKGIRRSVPKGLPYFHVDFGLQNGFAHVVEDEAYFPSKFAQEIIGGMLDVEPRIYKNPKRENFDSQKQRVMQFGRKWKDYDFTKKCQSSDSE